MTPLCNIGVMLPRALGREGVHRDAIVAEQATRTRSLAFIGKNFDQLFFGHPLRDATLADAIADALKLGRFEGRSRWYSCCERGTAANLPGRRKPTPPAAAVAHLIATSRRCHAGECKNSA